MIVVSKAIRDHARGQECTLRIPGVCNHNPDTTVYAHLPCGQKGVGMKSPDNMGVDACSDCHAFIDGPRRWEVAAYDYLRALAETQMRRIEAGIMTIKGVRA